MAPICVAMLSVVPDMYAQITEVAKGNELQALRTLSITSDVVATSLSRKTITVGNAVFSAWV
jgi:hypothetical protein